MKTSVQRILVLCSTPPAHLKVLHCGPGPIVGNVFDDREAWATIGTVDKWVAITTIRGIKQFAQTLNACRHVCGDRDRSLPLSRALHNEEFRIICKCEVVVTLDRFNRRQRRCVRPKVTYKFLDLICVALNVNHDAGVTVSHAACERTTMSARIHERSKANALHNTLNQN